MTTSKKNKLRRTGLILVIPLGLGLADFASACPHGSGAGGKMHMTAPMKAKMAKCRQEFQSDKLAKFDTDKDGTLSKEERRAARSAKKAELLAKYDQDKDGVLSTSERKELMRAKAIEKFERADENADATISLAEAQASCGPLQFQFERIDVDKDGSISWEEFEQGIATFGKGRRGGPGKHGRRGKKHRQRMFNSEDA